MKLERLEVGSKTGENATTLWSTTEIRLQPRQPCGHLRPGNPVVVPGIILQSGRHMALVMRHGDVQLIKLIYQR